MTVDPQSSRLRDSPHGQPLHSVNLKPVSVYSDGFPAGFTEWKLSSDVLTCDLKCSDSQLEYSFHESQKAKGTQSTL